VAARSRECRDRILVEMLKDDFGRERLKVEQARKKSRNDVILEQAIRQDEKRMAQEESSAKRAKQSECPVEEPAAPTDDAVAPRDAPVKRDRTNSDYWEEVASAAKKQLRDKRDIGFPKRDRSEEEATAAESDKKARREVNCIDVAESLGALAGGILDLSGSGWNFSIRGMRGATVRKAIGEQSFFAS